MTTALQGIGGWAQENIDFGFLARLVDELVVRNFGLTWKLSFHVSLASSCRFLLSPERFRIIIIIIFSIITVTI